VRTHAGGELRERAVSVDSVVDSTFPDLGVNTSGLGVRAAVVALLSGVLTPVGMNVALYSDRLR